MTNVRPDPSSKVDDADYPAYTMGRAADILDVQPGFLRSLDATGLLSPHRSAGGHRRYSRAELALAARVRELLDENMPLAAAFRIVTLEHQLEVTQRHIAELEARAGRSEPQGAVTNQRQLEEDAGEGVETPVTSSAR